MSNRVQQILRGLSWLLAMSWYSRILGMTSIIILARNLDKNDFGIIAGCFVVQGFFKVISDVGSGKYLLRKNKISKHDLNAAWTIGFISKCVIAILLFLLSGQIANFMNIAELALVLKVMALSAFFIGCQNPAINIKVKQLDYSQMFLLETVTKTISTSLSIFIVVIYQTYWAIVVSEVVYQFIYAVGSHFVVFYRPRFVIRNVSEQWKFSKWVLLKGVLSYIKTACDKIVVSRSYSLGDLGLYNFSSESASTALRVIISPINQIIYPGLSVYIEDKPKFVDKVYKSILILSCIYVPVIFGGVYLSELIVPFVFGEQWTEAIPMFDIFLIMTFSGMMVGVLTDVFTLTGEVKKQFYYELLTSIVFLFLILFISSSSLEKFSLARAFIAYLMLVTLILFLKKVIPISLLTLVRLILPPILSSVVMVLLLSQILTYFIGYHDILLLVSLIAVGAFFYIATLSLLIIFLRTRVNAYDFLYKTCILPIFNVLINRKSTYEIR